MTDEKKALEQIDSLYFDYKLENINGKCDNCLSCYEYGSTLKNSFSFRLLCQRLVKNIEYIHVIHGINGKYSDKKSCNDFIYWIYNNVSNMNDITDKTEINNIFNELTKVWVKVNEKLKRSGKDPLGTCNISEINTLDFDELRKKKIMSDYCQNFENLRIKLTSQNRVYCDIYYEYFMKTKKAYDDVFKECYEQGAGSKCPNVCKDKHYDPEIILTKLKCNKIPAPEKQQKFILEETCNAEKVSLKSELQRDILAASNRTFDYSDPRVVSLILFTFWGIFITFFFLYKVTPFGSWIRNNLFKEKIVRDNFDEPIDDESIYDYSESVNTNMQNAEYNISYNNDWNP
ncbi:Plasmodium vivax Vir protein, putative [Plasmodium ovale]|uniref:Plasmodium vivax Vir protein, putative n=1 Tax=Plasmodium ovale TaxID=36330 RepID=A0A1C3KJU5_PLAOA|nr:Plasmodium vivax Vir protein, putative [Plasmodium ovale]